MVVVKYERLPRSDKNCAKVVKCY